MRNLISILIFIFLPAFSFSQKQVSINGESGKQITINNGEPSTLTINHQDALAIGVSKQQINLSWSPHPNATKYIIEQATSSDYSDAEQIYAGVDFSYAATGLSQNTTYYFRYSWTDNDTASSVFSEKSTTTLNSGGDYDIDAAAIIAAIQFNVPLSNEAKYYINDFVDSLKSNNLWDKIYTIHVGTFASVVANSVNWRNPDFNNINGFPEMYSGAVTHNNGKISFAGASTTSELTATRAFSTNWIVPSNYLSQNNKAFTFNITDAPTTSTGDWYVTGASITTPVNAADRISLRGIPGGVQRDDEIGLSGVVLTGTNFMTDHVPALYVFQRSGSESSDVLGLRDGSTILTELNSSTGQPTVPIGTGGYYHNGLIPNPLGYKTYGRNFYAVTESLNEDELAAWQEAINTLLGGLTSITFTPKSVNISNGRFVRFFGDSFTQWQSAGSTSGERGWWPRVGQRFGILPVTSGVGGVGYYSQTNACHGALETPSLDRISILVGYNDVKVFGTAPTGIEHAKSGIRSMLANQFLDSAVAASSSDVTKTGTWANPSLAGSKAAKLGGTALQSSTSGDKISYTFYGDNVVIGVCNADGSTVTYGSVSITVDGNSQGTYSANFKAYNVTSSGGRIWNAIILKGFGDGNHTVELTLESSVNFVVDYFGKLRNPDSCFHVTIGDIQYDNTGTPNRNENADALTQEIKTMVMQEFPEYMDLISFPATNSYYNPAAPGQVTEDNVHPTDLGYKYIFRSVERVWKL